MERTRKRMWELSNLKNNSVNTEKFFEVKDEIAKRRVSKETDSKER